MLWKTNIHDMYLLCNCVDRKKLYVISSFTMNNTVVQIVLFEKKRSTFCKVTHIWFLTTENVIN